MPARDEFVDKVGADEAGRARDKTFHKPEDWIKPGWNLEQCARQFHKKLRARRLTCPRDLEKMPALHGD
jgi:hypothetical protein